MSKKSVVVIGGGAGGFFAAINLAESNPDVGVTILEKSGHVLGKVKVSGGGRCNVTHACFIPKDLVKFYPRGNKELLGPFHQFMTGDTMEWFENRGVALKMEDDNRVFPTSNSSQSIIDCFLGEAKRLGITVKKNCGVTEITKTPKKWEVKTSFGNLEADAVIVASGSSKLMWGLLEKLGHTIVEPIPSLFTFNTKDTRLRDLSGLVASSVEVKINGTKLKERGPLLVTHWGMSGPAILKLSSVGARILHEKQYKFSISVDWCFEYDEEDVRETFIEMKENNPKQQLQKTRLFELPKRLWFSFLNYCQIPEDKNWADISKKEMNKLIETLKRGQFSVNGKSTNKEEFVTCGGIDLKDINFKTFESKLQSNLFIVGECLNIDALTGGFNFQAAWTGGYIAGKSIEFD
jgi:predicted Rossmann fold flavoprotein